MASRNSTYSSGFTLIEISLVIVIIAVLIGMVVFSTQTRMDAARLYMTKQRMQTIMDSIDRYAELYGHIPCPMGLTTLRTSVDEYGVGAKMSNTTAPGATDCDDNDGDGDLIYVKAGLARGAVPFRLLNLDSQTAVDGWGNRFVYTITEPYSNSANYEDPSLEPATLSAANSYEIFNQGDTNISASSNVAYTLISHGANLHGGYRDKSPTTPIPVAGASADEDKNADSGGVYYQYLPTQDFDDIVIFKTRWQLPDYINE